MPTPTKSIPRGVSLIELIVFMVVVSIALIALVGVYRQATINNADPVIRLRALESAQSLLDEIIALKYDEATPVGGIPACRNTCTNAPDDNMDDVDDYHNFSDEPYPNYERSVSVTTANNIKLVTVSVTTPTGETFLLSAERANF
ncbi:MSHA biogenesis protein MshD [Cellvibrio mixtus]|uniref:MSHA biogenesis protein MshD n=1 Tax=Cellvibrio mixtus TaxID=39650 RepID=A0A266Q443_9GAMM|nr:MSHA biogenesis protein MshD [Cellvibrio mixtus]OZY84638.1 MSHA biogenesis protein MshD [Cellvibrio mixtus]